MTYKFTRATNGGRPPGSWKPATGTGKANLTCPGCHATISLTHHTVGADGLVSPMLTCPHHDCEFAEFVELQGWARSH